eukprot:TRINITY_DN50141_c0_g1_i1.p1 TRINITY_DN50141_c0_g1~~TRINITY_DN50141_c0_g1_i1.p1  ORF type:complete len:237 (-),score=23.32 TRINITY_DN50141_c0_g1_i1:55-765(-)
MAQTSGQTADLSQKKSEPGGELSNSVQDTINASIQAAAAQQAHQGLVAAGEGAVTAASYVGSEIRKYIQGGPAGVSRLCLLGGLATAIVGVLSLLNVFEILASPFTYVIDIYLAAFGITGAVLEVDIERLSKMKVIGRFSPSIGRCQASVHQRANFLTQLFGRGLFYFFVGSLAITQCMWCLHFVVGLWNVLMGATCISISYGVNPMDRLPANPFSRPSNPQTQTHDHEAVVSNAA